MDPFIGYMIEFYGCHPHAIYPFGFTQEQIEETVTEYKLTVEDKYPGQKFEGDSVDRERIRDMLINKYQPEQV